MNSNDLKIKIIEGSFKAPSGKVALVVSRFNSQITERLLEGCLDSLTRHGWEEKNIEVARVPGAWELPVAASCFVSRQDIVGVIVLGCLIRGGTPHFDYIASSVTGECGALATKYQKPVIYGLLTTESLEQALERSGSKMGNKGFESGMALIETVNVLKEITGGGTSQ